MELTVQSNTTVINMTNMPDKPQAAQVKRTLYTENACLCDSLSAMLKEDSVTPIEIPPEQYRCLAEANDPALCDCVKPGNFTYAQAVTVAEQQLVNGLCLQKRAVECTHPKGLNYAMCYALSIWNGADESTARAQAESLLSSLRNQ